MSSRALLSLLGTILVAVAGCGGTATDGVGAEAGRGGGGAGQGAGGAHLSGGGPSAGGEGGAGGTAQSGGTAGAGGSPYPPCDCALLTVAADVYAPGAVALDGEHVYWTQGSGDSLRIMEAPLAGGEAVALVTASQVDGIQGLAVDSSFVYWGDAANVKRAPLSGGEPVTVVEGVAPTDWVSELAVDSTSVYWIAADWERDGVVFKAPSAGGDPVVVASVGGGIPFDLKLNATHVYWVLRLDGLVPSVMRTPIEGGPAEPLAPVGDSVEGIALDGQYVYRTGFRSLLRAPIEGGPWRELAPHTTRPTGVASTGRHVYWGVTSTLETNGNVSGDAMDGALLRTAPDGTTTVVAQGMNPRAVATNGEWVCWTAAAWMAYGDRGHVMCVGPER